MSDLQKLDTLIPRYAENKAEFDSYKKICDKENAEIKSIMADFAVQKYQAGGYKASYSVSTRETMNEEMLLSLFSSVPAFNDVAEQYGIIKTRSYIDFDALEKAMYDSKFTDEQLLDMDKTIERKTVVTLKVTKVKEKKEEE